MLRERIALDAEADPDREDLLGDWDTCGTCGDPRKDHRERSGGCWVCRGHVDESARCKAFVNA